MRLLLAASMLALLAGPAATQPTPAPPFAAPAQPAPEATQPNAAAPESLKPGCISTRTRHATVLPGPPPSVRRLDELPPANLQLAVHREIDGCIEPVIVRYGVGEGFGRR